MNTFFISLFIIGSVACSTSPEPIAVHDFGVPITHQARLVTEGIKIDVTAPEWLTDTRIRYRLNYADKTQIRYYAKDRWIAPPVQLFEQYLLSQKAQSLDKVETSLPGLANQADYCKTASAIYRLRIHVLDFEQQFDTPERSRVLLSLLVEAYDRESQLVFKQSMPFEQASSTADAKGAINAFARLIHRAVQQINLMCL